MAVGWNSGKGGVPKKENVFEMVFKDITIIRDKIIYIDFSYFSLFSLQNLFLQIHSVDGIQDCCQIWLDWNLGRLHNNNVCEKLHNKKVQRFV